MVIGVLIDEGHSSPRHAARNSRGCPKREGIAEASGQSRRVGLTSRYTIAPRLGELGGEVLCSRDSEAASKDIKWGIGRK